ncbi:hypothetical protein PMAYCL1PPCAC_31214 [Pristionchus mayeri]|uniref:Uncharacterized protein n=1 Tax=Pristionchus mayeri TaxID=1317129 RepID=A0AAN5IDY4_9BILA|nr:hypothetical protein PMAYCL1PPCAC_31214 [Pristionchus mayeri]
MSSVECAGRSESEQNRKAMEAERQKRDEEELRMIEERATQRIREFRENAAANNVYEDSEEDSSEEDDVEESEESDLEAEEENQEENK